MEATTEAAEASLATLRKEKLRLTKIGLSLEVLAEFSQRAQAIAQHHRITPGELRKRLLQELENLDQALGLETLIKRRKSELVEQEQAIAAAKKESLSLKTVINNLQREKASLEASIKETREKVAVEMTRITTAARDMVNTLAQELRRGHDKALAEVQRLRDEAVEVGKEIGQYKETLQANEWLRELLALVRGEETIEGKRVRAITLLVLRGTNVWLRNNGIDNLAVSTIELTTESLIKELEQWKV
jgi:alanyl-tRNA synthetase